MHKLLPLSLLVCGFVSVPVALAAPVNSCGNVGVPVGGIVDIQCTFYSDGSPNAFNLQPLMTQNGAALSDNDYPAGYFVLFSGNVTTATDNASGLLNPSLWQAVI